MRELEKQECERINAFRERLRKRILKEVSQTSKDFAILKAERLLKEKAEMKQRAEMKQSGLHRTSPPSTSPPSTSRSKFAAYRASPSPPRSPPVQSCLRRPKTAKGTESQSKAMGLESIRQAPRPKTSHNANRPQRSDPRGEDERRPKTTDSNQVAQGSGRQGVASIRANRVISSPYASPNISQHISASPTFATTVKIYRSIQCNPNPSLKRYLMWKKRNNIAFEAKVFTISGEKNFFYIRRALLDRGWIENKDSSTEFFDMKWSLHSADIKHINLRQDQIVNHFEHASNITTKCGLLKTFKEFALSASVDALKFYPRSYELSTEEGKWEFDKDFEMTAALSILKRAWVDLYTGQMTCLDKTVHLAMDAWRARLKHLKNMVAEDFQGDTPWAPKMKNLQWNQIRSADIFVKPTVPLNVLREMDAAMLPPPEEAESPEEEAEDQAEAEEESVAAEPTEGQVEEVEEGEEVEVGKAGKEGEESSEECSPSPMEGEGEGEGKEEGGEKPAEEEKTCAKKDRIADMVVIGSPMSIDGSDASTQDHFEADAEEEDEETSETPIQMLEKLLREISQWSKQSHIDGMHNIWIVKPGGKSRGRGIKCFNNLEDIWTYVRQDYSEKWVVQKYIERPLIVYGRKFDIRQWVLVTDWNPLTVWMYKECYLRFAVENFDLLNLDSYIHLCNNSIVTYSDRFEKAAGEIESDGNMWSMERFQTYLAEEHKAGDAVQTKILPQIREIITESLRSAQNTVKDRNETCQVFGYDFLVADDMNVWLLKINSSPTMEPSNALTARLCKEFQEDTVKVIVDLPAEQLRRQRSGEARIRNDDIPQSLDLGNFECIISDTVQARQPKYVGLNLVVNGRGVKRNRGQKRARRRSQVVLTVSDLQNRDLQPKDAKEDKENKSQEKAPTSPLAQAPPEDPAMVTA